MASLFDKLFKRDRPQAKSSASTPTRFPVFSLDGGLRSREIEINPDYRTYTSTFYKANSVVFASIQALSHPFSELRFAFQDFKDGRPGEYELGEGLELLAEPWPGATTAELNTQAIQNYAMAGNMFVAKDKRDKGTRLRVLRPDWVQIIMSEPVVEAERPEKLGYMYWPGGVRSSLNGTQPKPVFYTVDEVAHWMPIPDPECPWRGMSPLQPVVEEALADSAATQHRRKFFNNAATPSLMVMLREQLTEEEFIEIKAQVEAATGADAAYDPMVIGGGADVKVVGADLTQVDFRNVQGPGETRIAAALGVHPVLVPLSEGMQGSSLNAGNAKVAKDIMIDMTLRPLAGSWASALSQIVPPPADKDGSASGRKRLWYDDRDVSFFREDRKELTDVFFTESETIARLIREGYTWDSVIAAVNAQGDWKLLEHTGLFSVQLWPPGESPGPDMPETPGPDVPTEEDGATGLARRSVNPNPGTSDEATSTARKPPKQKPKRP